MLVGEAPGEQEAIAGKPFVGAAGFFLDRILRRAGLNRATFALHNVLSCRPPNNHLVGAPYEQAAIAQCAPNLDRSIQAQQPNVIVALGNTALRRLIPTADSIHRFRGFVLHDEFGRPVVPTFHPSYLLPRLGQENTSRMVGVVIRDLRKAVRISERGFVRLKENYLLDPAPDAFAMWIAEFERAYANGQVQFLSFDIETPYKLKNKNEDDITDDEEDADKAELPIAEPILRISFSYRVGTAVTVPWRGEYLQQIALLLGHPCAKAVWNGVRFDVPVIESHNVTVAGRIYDFMWGFHVWQSDLPKSLEFAASLLTDLMPWKHTSEEEPAKYNAMDADAQLRCGIALYDEMTASDQWDVFERHVVELDPLLMAMGKRGVLIDREAQDALRAELESARDSLITDAQLVVPKELLPFEILKKPDSWGLYESIKLPSEKVKRCSACGALNITKGAHITKGGKKNPCHGATVELVGGTQAAYKLTLDFNPNSVQSLLAYANHFKHPIPLNHKTKKPTLDKKAIERLKKTKGAKHPIYGIALKLRGVRKTLGTYVEGFAPDREGLIHTTFGHHPSSLRLSSRNVNLQNVSHRGGVAYADQVRACIIPRPGYVFVEADSSAIEAVMTGYFMGSAEYITLAKKGIHDYLNCFEHGVPFDADGIAKSKGEWKDARDRNKIVVHGTSYGMTPYLMHMQFPEIFPHVADAERAQRRFFDACPGLREWQHETRVFAHKQAFLQNPWHYRHYFYDVFAGKDRSGNYILGEDAKRCVSFLPQSSAAAFMKDNLIMLSKSRFWPMPAIGLVHDSYCLEVREDDVEEAIQLLIGVLTRPIPEMQGLVIGCDVKVSVPDKNGKRNWNSMQKAA
jgi:uracil-DNA glycosylase family 4